MLRRALVRLLAVAVVLLFVLAGYLGLVAVRRGRPVVLPSPSGPHQVGRMTFDWVDAGRVDPLAPRPGVRRELSVWVWYPALRSATRGRAAYAPDGWDRLHLPGLLGLFEGPFSAVRSSARDGAPVAAGHFPVVVLEPGMGFSAPQYTVLAEDLASRGYLVAGVTPTYSANLSVLHGQPVSSTPRGNPPDLGGHTGPAGTEADRLVDVWAADARYVADTMVGLDRSGPFASRVAPTQVGYAGHSFGGAAALQACSTDPRCAGAVDLDGTQFGAVVHGGLHAPMLLVGSDGSCVTGTCRPRSAGDRTDRETARSLLAASTGPAWCYRIEGTKHLNFTDDAALYLAPPVRNLFALGSIDGDRGLKVQNAYVGAFLEQAFRRLPQPLLDAGVERYPEMHAGCGRP